MKAIRKNGYKKWTLNVAGQSRDAYAQVEYESLSNHHLVRYFKFPLILRKKIDDLIECTLCR
jgi:hypothetical protein